MIRAYYYQTNEPVRKLEGIDNFDKLLEKKDSVLWVDLHNPDDKELYILRHDFKFHPLAIEDVISEKPSTKVDDYDDYIFVVFQIVDFFGKQGGLKNREIDFFLYKNALVTVHYDGHRIFDELYERAEKDERLFSRGAEFLFHAIIDAIVDNYNSTLDILEYEIEEVEDDVLGEPDKETVKAIYTLRRDIVNLKRMVMPQKELVSRFARGDFKQITEKSAVYFSDVHDHLLRIDELANFHREILNSSLETYYSSVSTKTNEIIKFLTIFTVLFIPPTFMVGLWGMNFSFMPELQWEQGYFYALGIMSVIVTGLLIFFRKKKWL